MNFKKIIFSLLFIFPIKAYSENDYDLNIFDNNKAFSIISVNYFYNKQLLLKNSKTSCKLNFRDDYKEKVFAKIDENSSFIILLSNPGKVFLESIECSRHSIPLIYGASRFKYIDDMGFVAHKGFVNYLGELNLYYYPSFFKILDIFNLSNFSNDLNGLIQIDVEDKIIEAVNFINSRFKNIYHLKLTKSLLIDSHSLKPNEEPDIYSQNDIRSDLDPKNFPQTIAKEEKIENSVKIDNEINKKVESISQNDLIENMNNDPKDNFYKSDTPQHPYLAPKYSDFYSPIYDPYIPRKNPLDYYLMNVYDVQDPVMEHPH